jgi:hypothetical protein
MSKKIESCLDIPRIQTCEATECSYNTNRSCHAVAITVGDSSMAHCDTFFSRSRKGGIESINAGVGACKMESCKFNTDLECSAEQGINISSKSGQAMCSTYVRS